MKKFQRFCTLFLLMIGLCSFALHAQSYAGLWRQVEQAQKKSLPQTVVKLTEKIYRKAELEKNAPANAQGIYLSGGLSGKTDSG